MLHHRCKCNRYDGNNCGNQKRRIGFSFCKNCKYRTAVINRQANPCCLYNRRKIDQSRNGCNCIGTQYAQQNRNDFDHPFPPDIADDYHCNSDQCNSPIGGTVFHCRFGKIQSNGYDDRSCHNRWEKLHYLICTINFEQSCKHQINKSCNCHTKAGVWQQFFFTMRGNRSITCQKRK